MKNFEKLIDDTVLQINQISGGCIGNSYRVKGTKGLYFVKSYYHNESINEANGLIELAKAEGIGLPELLNFDNKSIVLRYIEEGRPSKTFQNDLGTIIAKLHRIKSDNFGFYEDNYIGSTPQINLYKSNWMDFYITNRLDFQFDLAGKNGFKIVCDKYKKLKPLIPGILEGDNEIPSLLHGDLWSGNVICSSAGSPIIIDPAVYYGSREIELVMTKLFGGFSNSFYNRYKKEYPLQKGWEEREKIYTLYHVMNHLNIFGSGYRAHALQLINYYL